ncbi:MAG: DUF1365 family protein, partial [Jatrophihabitantaceae bacterium]
MVTEAARRDRPVTDPATPACYQVKVSHRRRDPVDYGFSQRSATWLIDLADVPSLPRGLRWLCSFRSADHLGDRQISLRQNLNRFLAQQQVAEPS